MPVSGSQAMLRASPPHGVALQVSKHGDGQRSPKAKGTTSEDRQVTKRSALRKHLGWTQHSLQHHPSSAPGQPMCSPPAVGLQLGCGALLYAGIKPEQSCGCLFSSCRQSAVAQLIAGSCQ